MVKPVKQKRKPKATISRDIEEIPTIPETIVEDEGADSGREAKPSKRKGKKREDKGEENQSLEIIFFF